MRRKIEKQAKKRYVKPIVKSEVLNDKFKGDVPAYAQSPDYLCPACTAGGCPNPAGPC